MGLHPDLPRSPYGIGDYRNPSIAGALRTLGYMQSFGFGIAEALRAMAAPGTQPPEFQVELNHVPAR
jgi:ATP-dependent DNA helicase RecG